MQIPENCYTMRPVGDVPIDMFAEFVGDMDESVGNRRRLVMFLERPALTRKWEAAAAITSTGEPVPVWVRRASCGLKCYCAAEFELIRQD